MNDTTITIGIIAVASLVVINMTFAIISIKYIYAMLLRMEAMYKDITGQQYQTLNNVCESYKGVCESYHNAHDVLQTVIDKVKQPQQGMFNKNNTNQVNQHR